jgi:alpha-tubulin suppressor-like RCC1 family protein
VELKQASRECNETETALAALRPRLCFWSDLSDCVALCLVKRLRRRGAGLFAMVSRSFRGHVAKARELGMLKSGVLAISAGDHHTVACLDTGVYTCGAGMYGQLGHAGFLDEHVPRVVEAVAGNRMAGASAGSRHTVVWTEGGEVYTFGSGELGKLGHGGEDDEDVPKVVEALAGQKVVGASAGAGQTVVWTEGCKVYTFGWGRLGRLGHGRDEIEDVPRAVEALAGKKVVGRW